MPLSNRETMHDVCRGLRPASDLGFNRLAFSLDLWGEFVFHTLSPRALYLRSFCTSLNFAFNSLVARSASS